MPAKTRVQLLEENIDLRERVDDIVEILEDEALNDDDKLDRISDLFDETSGDNDEDDDEDDDEEDV